MAPHPPEKSLGPTCILNGHSVHVEEAQARIARISGELGAQAHVIVTRKGDDISSLAARAARENRLPVVAGGGDGTVNAVAGTLVGSDAALGVLPMGTLNHFAKDVGIPQNLEAAVRNIFTGQVTNVDVGEVNGRVFVNNSGVGFYPHFVRQREEQERHGHVKHGQRYTPLDQITANNAANLIEICSYNFPEKMPSQMGPTVYNGAIFATTAHYTVALDGASCKVIWQSEWKPRDHETYVTHRGDAIKRWQVGAWHRRWLSRGVGHGDRRRAVVAADCTAQQWLFLEHAASDLRRPCVDWASGI